MRKIFSISELTRDIKEVLENVFDDCLVQGEISNLRAPGSGHIYLSLKDEACSLRCVIFRNAALRLKFRPVDGIKVIASGRIGVYEKDGQYQLTINELEPKGQGALQLAYEQLKDKLAKEGLFDEGRKKSLPFLPRTIGIVTSPTGAVIRDMLHVLARRFPLFHVILYPVRVQGDGAAQEIAGAIRSFNEQKNVDVMVLARGGGSVEDLWAFNEETVARAIASSEIPVISAVGHETDFTISDFVADKRAPTPSAAAEIVMPALAELEDRIDGALRFLWRGLADFVPQAAQRLDDAVGNLVRGMEQKIRNQETVLGGVLDQLQALNPLAILKRGYSLTTSLDGKPVLCADELKVGDRVRTRLNKGVFMSEVFEVEAS
jgi:exodeoxyribonuclease VII large subunit